LKSQGVKKGGVMKQQLLQKKSLVLLLCLLFGRETKAFDYTFRQCYLFAKALIVLPYHMYAISEQNYELTKLQCNQCRYVVTPAKLYGWLMGKKQFATLSKLQQQLSTNSASLIAQFMLKLCYDKKIPCPVCADFVGWRCVQGDI